MAKKKKEVRRHLYPTTFTRTTYTQPASGTQLSNLFFFHRIQYIISVLFFFSPSATWLLLAAAFVSREPGGLRPGSCSMEIITATTSETYLPPRKPFCQQVWSTITRGSGWILHDQIINPPVQGREPDRNTSGESTLRGFLALFFICYPPPTDE